MKNITFLFFVQDILACMCLTDTAQSCAGWVVGAGNLISVPAVNSPGGRVQSTYFGVSYFLLEELYYTVFEFYEDRRRAARRVFAKTTYRF